MNLKLSEKQSIDFINDSEGGWFGQIVLGIKKYEFTIENRVELNWNLVKSRLQYFIQHFQDIMMQTESAIIEFQKKLGWNVNTYFAIECIEIILDNSRLEEFVILYDYDDISGFDYVQWEILIHHQNGPKVLKVRRE